MSRARPVLRWAGVFLSAIAVIFAALSYVGIWHHLRGDDLLEDVASRFDLSYAAGASKPVKVGDTEWAPLIRVINKYTHASLRRNKRPVVFARMQAIASAERRGIDGSKLEWTAPSTPVLLIYSDWPVPNGHGIIPKEDVVVVGTIADLHEWIRKDEADFDFLWRTLIFGGLSACVGVFLAMPEKSKDRV